MNDNDEFPSPGFWRDLFICLCIWLIVAGVVAACTAEAAVPKISGKPPEVLKVGERLSWEPTTSDADGDKLRFVIKNRPPWASFGYGTGGLYGTPTQPGTWSGIVVYAKDGQSTVAGPTFSISVIPNETIPLPPVQACSCPVAPLPKSVTLSWTPPTQNTDNTPLTDLTGYLIEYGPSPTALTQTIQLTVRSSTSYIVENLASGTWYFAIRAVAGSGRQSRRSNIASHVIP